MVSLALICTFSRMRSFLGLSHNTKRDNVPDRIVKSVAEVLRKSNCLRVSDDGEKFFYTCLATWKILGF